VKWSGNRTSVQGTPNSSQNILGNKSLQEIIFSVLIWSQTKSKSYLPLGTELEVRFWTKWLCPFSFGLPIPIVGLPRYKAYFMFQSCFFFNHGPCTYCHLELPVGSITSLLTWAECDCQSCLFLRFFCKLFLFISVYSTMLNTPNWCEMKLLGCTLTVETFTLSRSDLTYNWDKVDLQDSSSVELDASVLACTCWC